MLKVLWLQISSDWFCSKFLDLEMKILGHVVNDPPVGEGIRSQQAFSRMFPIMLLPRI